MGAHRPLDASTSEVRRLYVCPEARGMGVAERLLGHLEAHAKCQDFTHFRLETGPRQLAAMRLYEKCGFARIPAFGPYLNDPVSICYEKVLGSA
jgi:ribosomal protein S18 acetylase RimI-like enzyme